MTKVGKGMAQNPCKESAKGFYILLRSECVGVQAYVPEDSVRPIRLPRVERRKDYLDPKSR